MGLLSRLERRSSEFIGDLRYPKAWMFDAFGAVKSISGVSVNERTALNLGVVFACVRVLSEDIAKLPLFVYERLDRGKRRAIDHPLYPLLTLRPNPEMTAFRWKETGQAHLLTWGNHYAQLARNGAGEVAAIWPLKPDRMDVRRDPPTAPLSYIYTREDGSRVRLPNETVLHIPGLGFDGLIGYSPVRMAREAIGLGMAVQEFGSRFFSSGAHNSGVLQHPKTLSTRAGENLKKSFQEKNAGLEKAFTAMVLEEGMQWQSISIPPDDAQFLETRKFQRSEIAGIYRVPAHKINDLEKATFSNIEHQALEYVTDALLGWVRRWEQEINAKLFPDGRFFAEFLLDALLRGDIASRYSAYSQGRQWGWLSTNDIRELENMNPIADGDIYLQPMNMTPAGAPPLPRPTRGEVLEPIIQDSINRWLARKESQQTPEAAERIFAPIRQALLADSNGKNGTP